MIVHLLGVPMDLGSGRRGVDMGPSAIRIAGVADRLVELGNKVIDEGDVVIKNMEELKVGPRSPAPPPSWPERPSASWDWATFR
jgi:arginase